MGRGGFSHLLEGICTFSIPNYKTMNITGLDVAGETTGIMSPTVQSSLIL